MSLPIRETDSFLIGIITLIVQAILPAKLAKLILNNLITSESFNDVFPVASNVLLGVAVVAGLAVMYSGRPNLHRHAAVLVVVMATLSIVFPSLLQGLGQPSTQVDVEYQSS